MPEIGAQRQFITRPGMPAYDWDLPTLIAAGYATPIDLSSIVPIDALWVKFRVTLTAPTNTRNFALRNTLALTPNNITAVYSFNAPLSSSAEVLIKLITPQTIWYLGASQITAGNLTVLGWMF